MIRICRWCAIKFDTNGRRGLSCSPDCTVKFNSKKFYENKYKIIFKNCVTCNTIFSTRRSRKTTCGKESCCKERIKKYIVSQKTKRKINRIDEIVKCKGCEKKINKTDNRRKFCHGSCSRKYHSRAQYYKKRTVSVCRKNREKKEKPIIVKICGHCLKIFETKDRKRTNSRYCSPSCCAKYNSKKQHEKLTDKEKKKIREHSFINKQYRKKIKEIKPEDKIKIAIYNLSKRTIEGKIPKNLFLEKLNQIKGGDSYEGYGI